MKERDMPQAEPMTDDALAQWAQAFGFIATRYRVACSPGALLAGAPWLKGKPMVPALTQLAREAGLSFQLLTASQQSINSWRLPVVVALNDGRVGVIEHFDGDDTLEVSFFDDQTYTNRLSMTAMLPAIRHVIALRPLAALKDSRVDAYISKYRPDWLYRLVMRDLRPYSWVMLAALFINVLSLSGIVFSMQVYDRVIPAQSYPTLYVLTIGVLIATLFGFVLRVARGHIMDLLGKRSDLRVSDRVFGHALRLRNSAIPRSTGSFISQLRELEQIREMVTSSTISTIVDLPFFLLFVVVLAIIAPQLAWIAPVAAVIMVLPGLLLQKKLAELAKQSAHESTLRNAVLVESVQGLEDIKLMQAENRFLQQWNSYIQITAESGLRTREQAQFRYHPEDPRMALRINRLEIKPGEKVAILGRNGAGKSTLLQAMAGGMDLAGGELRLDNLSLPHLDVADVRRNVGFMTQNARLFYGTLRENITLGMPRATDEEIFAALELTGAASFVQKLPKGLDYPIMENGVGLSGGQRQSILLARMLLRDPNIVLMDEPTASLDEHTEREFIQRLSAWLGHRTLIVATHRVPVLELVERVVVLKEGMLVMDAPKAQALNNSRMQQQQAAAAREWKNENQSA